LKRKLFLLSVLVLTLPGVNRAEGWGWSVRGGYSRLEYSHERQSSPAGFYGSSFFPELTAFKAEDRYVTLLGVGMWSYNNWKYSKGGESAPEQKMLKFVADWEQHRYLGRNANAAFRFYAGPVAGVGFRRWSLNYAGGTDLTYRLANVRGGVVLGSVLHILPGLTGSVQADGKGLVGWYSSRPTDYANSNGVESGLMLGLKAEAGIHVTNRIQLCPGWSYIYSRDYNKRYSLIVSEQRWFVSLKVMPFHAK
jgi:hypothetical protein